MLAQPGDTGTALPRSHPNRLLRRGYSLGLSAILGYQSNRGSAVNPAANDSISDRPSERASDRAQFILAVQKASSQAFRQGMWVGVFIGVSVSLATRYFIA